jgi:zinc/manganese transport system substrate-binding protein
MTLLRGTPLLRVASLAAPLLLPWRTAAAQDAGLHIVTSLTTYAAIAREIVGDRGTVVSIARGDENPHFVQPRPSYVIDLKKADMFVTTGLDLELWVPTLLDKAGNSRIREGSPGYVTAYAGIDLLDVPTSVSRSAGDIHLYGNPHIWTDPANAIIIGGNILAAAKRLDPAGAAGYDQRYAAWKDRVLRAYVGDDLVNLLGGDVVFDLARQGKLWDFAHTQQFQGKPLAARVGGWMKQAEVFHGKDIVCYHKEWDYFSRAFGIPCVEYIEPKPGIPPTPRHVSDVMTLMRDRGIKVLFSTNYYDYNQVRSVAARTNAVAVNVPSNTDGAPDTSTYVDLVSLWVRELANAFGGRPAHP